MMQKLIRNHQWISVPQNNNIGYYGITDFAKNYFLRMKQVQYQGFSKTLYGIKFRHRIGAFLQRIEGCKYEQLCLSDQMEYDRFTIRRDEIFSHLLTMQFDVQLTAPIDMRIMDINFDVSHKQQIYASEWIYEVQILDPEKLHTKSGLMTQEQYQKVDKIIPYQGLLL